VEKKLSGKISVIEMGRMGAGRLHLGQPTLATLTWQGRTIIANGIVLYFVADEEFYSSFNMPDIIFLSL
jgi:hypothetical protein